MRISLNWLKEYVDLPDDVDKLAERMTMLGLEIESVERRGEDIQGVVVGEIKSIDPHPDADRLVVCRTDVGEGEAVQIVCGATNMSVGDRVPTAVVGGTLPGGLKIGRRKMRGVESQGMMCSSRELGLGDDHDGLLILGTDAPIGEAVTTMLGLDDVIMEIEVTPNRGDWASMIGVARELAAAFDTNYRIPEVHVREGSTDASSLSSVTIEDGELCPRYVGRVLEDVKVGLSPPWLCARLTAAGQRPINNVVDITNFVLLETGQPLHAFDLDKLGEQRIVVRRAAMGEKITTLDGESRSLDEEMLIIADGHEPVAVAGVMGGASSEVFEGTGRVFLESAFFNAKSVRRTSRSLGLLTEASTHFQRGADPEMALYAINRAAALMVELCGATCARGTLDEYPTRLEREEVTLRYARTKALLGTTIEGSRQKGYLTRLGFEVVRDDETSCTLRAPSWRHDVAHETDLIEEVARLEGYDDIEKTLPVVRKGAEDFAPEDNPLRRLRAFLVSQGLVEVVHWTFTCEAEVEKAGLGGYYRDMVTLANPMSENYGNMRGALLPSMLSNAGHNLRHGRRNLATFELGPVYRPRPEEMLPGQGTHLAVLLSGSAETPHWARGETTSTIYDLKGHAEAILDFLGAEYTIEKSDYGPYSPGQCGAIQWSGTTIGYLGQVSKSVMDAFEIEQPVFTLEVDVSDFLVLKPKHAQYRFVPKFPPSARDIAVVVRNDTPAGALRDAALEVGGKTLKSVEIFDIYTGDPVPEGKKSVALNLIFQREDRTLRDEDTQKAVDKILRKLRQEFQAEQR